MTAHDSAKNPGSGCLDDAVDPDAPTGAAGPTHTRVVSGVMAEAQTSSMAPRAVTSRPGGRRLSISSEEIAAYRTRGQSYELTRPDPDLVQVIDFFSGCGGMSWGFASTRQSELAYEVLAGVDIDDDALETYELNLPGQAVNADIRTIADDPSRLLDLVPGFDPGKRPFVFVGCPPCQGFSAHRKKDDRDDERNDLILQFAKVAAHFKPDIVVIENVPEMLAGRFEDYYQNARGLLEGEEYHLAEAVLDLSLYGVPQRRRRAIVIGSRVGPIPLPEPLVESDAVRTVRDAIGHLTPIAAGERCASDPWHQSPAHTKRIVDKIRRIPADGGDRRSLDNSEQLDCHRDVDAGKTPGFTDVYGRLRWDAPSVTITAKSSTPSCGRFLHPEQHRNISVREAALLQSFPHEFVFAGGFINHYRQIGEAVPPLFARAVAVAILNHLQGIGAQYEEAITSIARSGRRAPQMSAPAPVGIVDLFCGAGGIALGMHAAGFEPVLAIDNDAAAVATYAKNISDRVLLESVTSPSCLVALNEATDGRRYIISGGPPCQGFSQQRRGTNSDERNNLVTAYAELICALQTPPLAVVLENVMYLDSPRGRHIYADFVCRLESAGYEVTRHDLNSARFGVAQARHRIVLVAMKPEMGWSEESLTPLTAHRWPTVGEALRGLSNPNEVQLPNHVAASESEMTRRRIAYVDMGRGRTAIPEYLQLKCHAGYDGHLDVFGRLDWYGQARTITGGFDSASRGEYSHPLYNRSITAREAARIQGFPDWFEFVGNRADVRRQIGNAVPPTMAYAIGQAISRTLRG